MYPEGYQTFVNVTEVTGPLCGQSRPAFFRGVTTVVTKLFNIVKPHTSIFGEKDFQQLVTIRRMVMDLNMDIEIIGHPIVREQDGVAMSSRNAYLTPEQRRKAVRLNHSLREAHALVQGGERTGAIILKKVREVIAEGDDVRIDYARLCDPANLQEVSRITGPTLLALAVHVGVARLIDNSVLNPST
jgi:pantoate--beta-alanine ligase